MTQSKTAVVILNWNGVQFLQQFLPTLIQNTTDAQVVVIDNQSTDKSIEYIQLHYPSVQVVINEKNEGFAKGYNDGLKQLKGKFEYYILINSDIEVTPGWVLPLTRKLDENPTVLGVQPKILSYHKKNHFEYAGACGGFIDRNYYPFCRGRIFDVLEEDIQQYENEKEVFWVSGACMMVRASLFHELGGFDEDFFAHQEEIDFCWRAKKQNHSFFVIPTSVVYHVGGGTLNYESPKKTYLNFRNSLFMIYKNHEGWLFGKLFYRLVLDGIAGAKFLLSFKFAHIAAIIKAHFSLYGNLSSLRVKRAAIQKSSHSFNKVGFYKASILWAYFFKKIRTFNGLNKRFFDH